MTTIKRVLFTSKSSITIFSRWSFCDGADLEVLSGNLLVLCDRSSGKRFTHCSRGSDPLTQYLFRTTSSTPICSWLNLQPTQAVMASNGILILTSIHHLTLKERSCEMAYLIQWKAKFASHDLCGPMRVAIINGKNIFSAIFKASSYYCSCTDRARNLNKTPMLIFPKKKALNIKNFHSSNTEQNGVVKDGNTYSG
ncbi:hypothetical protein Tco_0723167 [Tanacetum coccineum]